MHKERATRGRLYKRMSDLRFEEVVHKAHQRIWKTLCSILQENLKVDFSVEIERMERLGFDCDNEILCLRHGGEVEGELAALAGVWLSKYVRKCGDLKERGLAVKVCESIILVQKRVGGCESYKLPMSCASRGQLDIDREFIVVDCNGNASFIEHRGVNGCSGLISVDQWRQSRMYLVLEIKIMRKKAEESSLVVCAEVMGAEQRPIKPRTHRGLATVHESNQTRLQRLHNVYKFCHEKVLLYTSSGITDSVRCMPKECVDAFGENGFTDSTDIEGLIDWQKKMKCSFVSIILNNLWLCEDDRLWKMRLDSDPTRVHEIEHELKAGSGYSCVEIEAAKKRQVEVNLVLIARSLRYFDGKGTQPKFRVQFFNHEKKKKTSGKAASTWHIIMDTFNLEFGSNGDNLPIRTPVTIKKDEIDPDIEELLVEFESNPAATLVKLQKTLLQDVEACRSVQPKCDKKRSRSVASVQPKCGKKTKTPENS